MFEIGKIYRYPFDVEKDGIIQEEVDGLPNFFFETRNDIQASSVKFQRGIHQIGRVKLEDGTTRIPAIIISSSPHKARTDMTPWEDNFDPDYGHIKYYGDAKNNSKKASEWQGNSLLLDMFSIYTSPDELERMIKGVPLIFLKELNTMEEKKEICFFKGLE